MNKGPIENKIINTLNECMNISSLKILNESFMHSVPEDAESHFKIVVVSDDFSDLKLIQRHRLINDLFREELNHIHALAMHTYTPAEWQLKNGAPESPQCAGGSKS